MQGHSHKMSVSYSSKYLPVHTGPFPSSSPLPASSNKVPFATSIDRRRITLRERGLGLGLGRCGFDPLFKCLGHESSIAWLSSVHVHSSRASSILARPWIGFLLYFLPGNLQRYVFIRLTSLVPKSTIIGIGIDLMSSIRLFTQHHT